ncbi:hypothetical protein BKA61DRAFT_220240 [Leptodontidium sp. MPI-SDFR-AT-0119]|nr:hypothetical protein BKA61DRAFT_220240 [Leptodontidium sp. MPI-SDFR-AT-0119]
MGLQVGHQINRQMALSYRVNSIVSPAVLEFCPSASEPVSRRRKLPTISETIYNIALRNRVHNRDWRKKIIQGSSGSSKLPTRAVSSSDADLQSPSLLSAKQFSGWELAWALGISEGRVVQIESEIHNARMAIGKQTGKVSCSHKGLKLGSRLQGKYSENLTQAGLSLLVEFKKLLRQMMVLAYSNVELRVNLERSTLEKNGIVQQIIGQHLAQRQRLHAPILSIGHAIRNRYIENSTYPKRNMEKAHTGNEAAHNGDALADAILYHPAVPNHRVDMPTYSNIYGLNPRQVWNLSNCEPFVKLITWYGTVKRWHPHNFASTSFAKA